MGVKNMWATSLRRQLLFWLLVPLAAVALFNVYTSYRDAQTLADLATDRSLLASARVIAENISASDGTIEANIPPSALELFVSEVHDTVAYQVWAPNGVLLAGNPEIKPPQFDLSNFAPAYFTTSYRGNLVRAVALAGHLGFHTLQGGVQRFDQRVQFALGDRGGNGGHVARIAGLDQAA